MPRIVPVPLATARLTLEPVTAAHASEMAVALADSALYEFTGGEPPAAADLEARYRRFESHASPDGTEAWLNWVIRARDDASLAGYVQATVASSGLEADVAWVVSTTYQGRGLATEATGTMLDWLRERGVTRVGAWIHPEHRASAGVARRLGFVATEERRDGEVWWSRNVH
ncbi:GNAT family N-acetyltransferase [Demequina sp. NBRC 110054]|uniref:GNAT family N-acetyltransferase n=1 Tax=Demequina sp. NBRC 110054 TaxID=1570343 RepID=UPI000A06817C|nr:GNAT family N-acetyltransferase [Demequina sp. NBRC 110054]